MRLPQIEQELRELAVKHGIPRLEELADEIPRRKRAVRAPATSTPMTEELKDAIRAYKRANPTKTQHQIASVFGVSQGRVSETLSGKRT